MPPGFSRRRPSGDGPSSRRGRLRPPRPWMLRPSIGHARPGPIQNARTWPATAGTPEQEDSPAAPGATPERPCVAVFALVRCLHGSALRSRVRRFESCWGCPVISQDIEDTANPRSGRAVLFLGLGHDYQASLPLAVTDSTGDWIQLQAGRWQTRRRRCAGAAGTDIL